MLFIYRQRLCLLVICSLLTACMPPVANIAPSNEPKKFETRKVELAHLNRWNINGGIAVKEGNQGFTASMQWQQYSASSFDIQFSGPLATGKLKLTKQGNITTLSVGKHRYTSNNAEVLLKKHTGYYVPVNSLFYWIRGLPSPNAPSNKINDAYGHLKKLTQQGWTIHYERFTHFKSFDVPSKIKLIKGNAKVKLVISKWQ